MILSRIGPLSRLTVSVAKNLLQDSNKVNFKQAVRTEKTYVQYRNPMPPDEFIDMTRRRYEIFGAALWWWFIWRLFSEYELILGPKIPDPKEWTDEELGVPPLEAADP